MKSTTSAVLLLASLVSAKHGVHEHLEALHRRHHEHAARSVPETAESGVEIRSATPETAAPEKRGGQCAFPYSDGIVPVTPGSQNAGWAMSPNQPCIPGGYCPYACPPGEVMMQWDPSATTYSYPESMNGGLYCDNNGNIQKPFPSKPYCQATSSNIGVVNNCGEEVAFCQTVLPGNEAMLIPTAVNGYATLANPDTSYWAGTAAHYYINPPGTSTDTACVWGTNQNPWGNWSPYVAGANTDDSGNTFIKLGWNPIYLEPATPFRNTMPNWGVKIDCPDGGCNGLPCSIDPSQNSVNEMVGSATDGAGGAAFCVVTVAKGSTANFVVFNSGGSQNDNGGQFYQASASSAAPSSAWSAPASSTNAWSSSNSESTSTWSSSSAWSSSAWASSSWSGNSTSSYHAHSTEAPKPSNTPYTSLPTAESTAANTQVASPTIQPVTATGAACSQRWSMAGVVAGLLFAAL